MKKFFAKILLTLGIAAMLVAIPATEVLASGNDAEFEEMLATLRREHFSPRMQRFGSGLETVIYEGEPIPHVSPPHVSLDISPGARGIAPAFAPQNYVVGSRRQFFASGLTAGPVHWGELVRQGQRVNIWILDSVTTNRPSAAQLNAAIVMYDDITYRMTRDFAPFAGFTVTTAASNLPVAGDVHNDGRVNVLLHNGSGGGYFWSANFTINDGNVPIAVFHMSPNHVENGNLFAHELQHLLFFIHFGVYAQESAPFTWFNEAMSMLAEVYWAVEGVAFMNVVRNWQSAENSYANPNDSRVGDFVSFNNSGKSYSVSMKHSMFMHNISAVCYAGAIYDFLRSEFPASSNSTQFMANRNAIAARGMNAIIGDAFYAAGLTGSTGASGEVAFDLMYFLFMEAFASDGGTVAGQATPRFVASDFSGHRLWGIRPNLGTNTPVFGTATGSWALGGQPSLSGNPLPTLASGGVVSMSGYNGTPVRGATHDRMMRLTGESTANPVIRVVINDPDSRTQYYIVVPNDAPGAVSSLANPTLGSAGATVTPLVTNGSANYINTGGQVAYLFVATLYRNVNTTVTYTWHATATPPPADYLQINGAGQYTTRAAFQPALAAALASAPAGATVEVTGTLSDADGTLTVNVPANRTVLWNASYTGPGGIMPMMVADGAGTFIVGPGGHIIRPTGSGGMFNANGNVIIDGGTIEHSGTGNVIAATGSGVLTIESGTVRAAGANVLMAMLGGRIIINGGTVEALQGTVGADRSITVENNSVLVINGGTIRRPATPMQLVDVSGTGAVLLTPSGVAALGAEGRINRMSGNTSVYFFGDNASRFTNFTLGTNLFRIDVLPTLSQTNPAFPVPEATATLSPRFAIPAGGITVNGVPFGGTATVDAATRTVTFSGSFNSMITLTVSGATVADGRINVPTFTTPPFRVSVGSPDAPSPGDVNFFYIINYGRETITFGRQFELNGETINRSEITYLFNRRQDRVENVNRGNWTMTLTGEVNISAFARRGGYIGVRRRLPNGQHELLAVIEIPARPDNRPLRAHRRSIYVPTIYGADRPGEILRNPHDDLIEVVIGNDRGHFGRSNFLSTGILEPGEEFDFPHDIIPRGTRGTFRVAPIEAVNFVLYNGEYWFITDLIASNVTYVTGYGNLQELVDAGGRFGSVPVRFNIPNQPNAPVTARMAMTEGRNGAPWFISRTNAHMQVRLGEDNDGNAVWGRLTANMPVRQVMDLFENHPDGPFALPQIGDYYVFEMRVFRANRIVSAPGFLSLPATEFAGNMNVTASVNPVVVGGTQLNAAATAQNPLNRNGVNVVVVTTGGTITLPPTAITATTRADVAHWFRTADGSPGGLPDGLTATLTRVQGARATITIHGIPTQTADNVAMNIVIPADYHNGNNVISVTNAPADGGVASARFNIAPAPVSSLPPVAPDTVPDSGDAPNISDMPNAGDVTDIPGFDMTDMPPADVVYDASDDDGDAAYAPPADVDVIDDVDDVSADGGDSDSDDYDLP
ncbi:MAG: hypothetical protein FWC70_05780 [Defluviitaleaceae bacterium]|nr:hypothetical protein [Defluviitaleaceae bacterium]